MTYYTNGTLFYEVNGKKEPVFCEYCSTKLPVSIKFNGTLICTEMETTTDSTASGLGVDKYYVVKNVQYKDKLYYISRKPHGGNARYKEIEGSLEAGNFYIYTSNGKYDKVNIIKTIDKGNEINKAGKYCPDLLQINVNNKNKNIYYVEENACRRVYVNEYNCLCYNDGTLIKDIDIKKCYYLINDKDKENKDNRQYINFEKDELKLYRQIINEKTKKKNMEEIDREVILKANNIQKSLGEQTIADDNKMLDDTVNTIRLTT